MVWGWSESAGVLLDCLQVHAHSKLLHLDGPVCLDLIVVMMVKVLVMMVVMMMVTLVMMMVVPTSQACREDSVG